MKIAFVTTYDASDVHGWSGLGFHLAKALQTEKADMEFIGNLNVRHDRITRMKKLFYSKALGQRYQYQREPWVAEGYAEQIASRLSPSANCIVSPGSVPIARIRSKIPAVLYTDATFAGMVGFYEDFSNLCAETIRNGHLLEQEALSSCAMAIYSSDWAARTAIENYSVDPRKVRVIPFGANIDCNRTREDIKRIVQGRPKDICRLLFLGVDWQRKGGPMALEIAKRLNKAGLKTELHVAGLRQPLAKLIDQVPDFVIDHGFISKSTPEGKARLEKLIGGSHFLVLLSKAEAYGLVLCEANSFGVPDIVSNVGGIPTIVRDEVNGKLFSLNSPAADHALYIANLFSDYDRYEELALSSFEEFRQRLNWEVAARRLMQMLSEL
ncbi:MAG: glycosyltransferase family 4 protein [Bacteroidetes bacterium]|nr:glycosyltransferase family 4 protein [Bacteroidota bacterium]